MSGKIKIEEPNQDVKKSDSKMWQGRFKRQNAVPALSYRHKFISNSLWSYSLIILKNRSALCCIFLFCKFFKFCNLVLKSCAWSLGRGSKV